MLRRISPGRGIGWSLLLLVTDGSTSAWAEGARLLREAFQGCLFWEIPMERFATSLRGGRLALHGLVVVL